MAAAVVVTVAVASLMHGCQGQTLMPASLAGQHLPHPENGQVYNNLKRKKLKLGDKVLWFTKTKYHIKAVINIT